MTPLKRRDREWSIGFLIARALIVILLVLLTFTYLMHRGLIGIEPDVPPSQLEEAFLNI